MSNLTANLTGQICRSPFKIGRFDRFSFLGYISTIYPQKGRKVIFNKISQMRSNSVTFGQIYLAVGQKVSQI